VPRTGSELPEKATLPDEVTALPLPVSELPVPDRCISASVRSTISMSRSKPRASAWNVFEASASSYPRYLTIHMISVSFAYSGPARRSSNLVTMVSR
jgi:hypothetical protein